VRMKGLLALGAIVLTASQASATLIISEPFNYSVTDGTNNSGISGTDGEVYTTGGGGYAAANGAAWQPTGYVNLSANYDKANDAVIVNNNLSVTGLAASTGNAVSFGGAGYTPRLDFRQTPGSTALDIKPTGGQSTVVYYSLAFQVTDLTGLAAGGGYMAGFNNSAGQQSGNPTVIAGRLNIKASGSGFNIGVSKASDSTAVYDAVDHPLNTTQFVVVKYQFGAAATVDDSVTIWINPSSSTFGGADPAGGITNTAGADITADLIRSFLLRQGNTTATQTPAVIADELRIGTTFADVTPVPEPSVIGLSALAGVGLLRRRRD